MNELIAAIQPAARDQKGNTNTWKDVNLNNMYRLVYSLIAIQLDIDKL